MLNGDETDTEDLIYLSEYTDTTGKVYQDGEALCEEDTEEVMRVKEIIDEAIKDKEKECLGILRTIEDDLNSEERAVENIEANDYEYTEEGELI